MSVRRLTTVEDGSIMLNSAGLQSLEGKTEYSVTVQSSIGHHERLIAPFVHPRTSVEYFADTITGALYLNGSCLSGDIVFATTPKKTKRAVPSQKVRVSETHGTTLAE